ncbi:MAG: hypothetical protein ACP5MK_03595 [Candidatus Micrarchaeia archaeon]
MDQRVDGAELRALRPVLLRSFNRNQLLILNRLHANSFFTITSMLNSISAVTGIPLSTLKANARVLKDLKLISFENPARLTEAGVFVMKIIDAENKL